MLSCFIRMLWANPILPYRNLTAEKLDGHQWNYVLKPLVSHRVSAIRSGLNPTSSNVKISVCDLCVVNCYKYHKKILRNRKRWRISVIPYPYPTLICALVCNTLPIQVSIGIVYRCNTATYVRMEYPPNS